MAWDTIVSSHIAWLTKWKLVVRTDKIVHLLLTIITLENPVLSRHQDVQYLTMFTRVLVSMTSVIQRNHFNLLLAKIFSWTANRKILQFGSLLYVIILGYTVWQLTLGRQFFLNLTNTYLAQYYNKIRCLLFYIK